jgi:hypothetical protein
MTEPENSHPSTEEAKQPGRNFNDDAEAAVEIGQYNKSAGAETEHGSERPWRAAKSLLKLRDQVNAMALHRDKSNDGTVGDASHQSRDSDHNPWVTDGATGVVTALDITHDPHHGCNAGQIVEAIRASKDRRVKYLIWDRHIANHAAIGGAVAWAWRPYHGTNPHDHHCHVSVLPNKDEYDNTDTWSIQ